MSVPQTTAIGRGTAYLLCALAVFALSVLFGLMVAAPVEPGDEMEWSHQTATEYRPPMPFQKRDQLIERVFLIAIIPSLIFTRLWLGSKSTETYSPDDL